MEDRREGGRTRGWLECPEDLLLTGILGKRQLRGPREASGGCQQINNNYRKERRNLPSFGRGNPHFIKCTMFTLFPPYARCGGKG